jgi:Spy/CpxP family protein refolding chaperone
MIMHTLKTLGLTFLMASLAMVPAYAQHHGDQRPLCRAVGTTGQFERLKQSLGLTPQQQAEIRTIFTGSRQDMAARRAALRENRKAVRDTLGQATLDEARLRQLLLRQSELRADRMAAQHALRARIKQVLTDEQQARWEDLRRQRMLRRGGSMSPAGAEQRSCTEQRSCAGNCSRPGASNG